MRASESEPWHACKGLFPIGPHGPKIAVGTISVTTVIRHSSARGCSPSPCLPYHFYQDLASLHRATYLPQECDAGATRAILGFQP
jgi:hypothetical protein